MQKNLLEIYFESLKHLPFSADEEKELSRKIQKGDTDARNKLIEANLRFVVKVAKGFINQGLPLEDLISAGNVGLITAAERFKGERGYKFISYAVWWVRQSILSSIQTTSDYVKIRKPLNQQAQLSKARKYANYLDQIKEEIVDFSSHSHIEFVATELEMKAETLEKMVHSHIPLVSLDTPQYNAQSKTLRDKIPDETEKSPEVNLRSKSLRSYIEDSLKTLKGRDAEIIKLYFGLEGAQEMSLEDIGEKYRITRERVRQIKERALTKLRNLEGMEMFREYPIDT